MKTSRALPVFALWLCALAVGCAVPALYGFEDETRYEFDPDLVCTWITADGDDQTLYRVGPGEGKTYELVVTRVEHEEAKALSLRAVVVRFGDRLIVDVSLSKEQAEKLAEQYGLLALPVHQFYRIVPEHDRLHVGMLEVDWIERWPGVLDRDDMPIVAANPCSAPHDSSH